MNKSKLHLIFSWTLLLIFAAGQFILYAHQHNFKCESAVYHIHNPGGSHQVVLEKCALCDQMYHAPVYWNQIHFYYYLQTPAIRIFETAQHFYKGNSLVHADGLSPPVLV